MILMMRRFFSAASVISLAAGALFLSGCETPNSRISENPNLFNSLPPREQELVSQGRIGPGMSRNAVYLAWGSPEQRLPGFTRGRTTETWVYFSTTTTGYGGYGGYGSYGGFGPYGYGGFYGGGGAIVRSHRGHRYFVYGDPFYDPFFYSSFANTIQYPYKTVTFVNGRVAGFQYLAPPVR